MILDTLQSLLPLPQHSYLVIIDGLDEYHDKVNQQLILVQNDHSSYIITTAIFYWESPRISYPRWQVVLDEKFDPERYLDVSPAVVCARTPSCLI